MNIIEAVNLAEHSPSRVAIKLKSFIFGFNSRRDVSYFDLFLFYPLYTYRPSYDYFNRNISVQNKMNFFITHSSSSPDIFANFNRDYYLTLSLIKDSFLYGVNNNYFKLDDDFKISLCRKTIRSEDKNKVAENIGKFYSCKSTAYLYDFFKVEIDAI